MKLFKLFFLLGLSVLITPQNFASAPFLSPSGESPCLPLPELLGADNTSANASFPQTKPAFLPHPPSTPDTHTLIQHPPHGFENFASPTFPYVHGWVSPFSKLPPQETSLNSAPIFPNQPSLAPHPPTKKPNNRTFRGIPQELFRPIKPKAAIEQQHINDLVTTRSKAQAQLESAILENRVFQVHAALKAGAQVNRRNHLKQTFLHTAAYCGHAWIVQILLDAGATLYVQDRYGMSVFDAAQWGTSPEADKFAVTNVLLARDMRIRQCFEAATSGNLGLLLGCLAQTNLPIDQRDCQGNTLLHAAVIANQTAIAQELIARGASLLAETIHGQTPLMIAQTTRNQEMIGLLALNTDMAQLFFEWVTNAQLSKTCLMLEQNETNIFIVGLRNAQGQTALHIAAAAGNTRMAQILLMHGARLNVADDAGITPLDIAIQNGNQELLTLVFQSILAMPPLDMATCSTPPSTPE